MIVNMDPSGPSNCTEQSHQLPDGSWVSLRVENDYLYDERSYFWLKFLNEKIYPAWYRVFPVGAPPPQWKPMKPAKGVDGQGGAEDEDSDKDAEETMRENAGKVGAARKLSKGRYVFQSKIRVQNEDVELTSVEFDVSRSPRSAGWG
jgi:hypothetical protein